MLRIITIFIVLFAANEWLIYLETGKDVPLAVKAQKKTVVVSPYHVKKLRGNYAKRFEVEKPRGDRNPGAGSSSQDNERSRVPDRPAH